jgi:hypothetical protein
MADPKPIRLATKVIASIDIDPRALREAIRQYIEENYKSVQPPASGELPKETLAEIMCAVHLERWFSDLGALVESELKDRISSWQLHYKGDIIDILPKLDGTRLQQKSFLNALVFFWPEMTEGERQKFAQALNRLGKLKRGRKSKLREIAPEQLKAALEFYRKAKKELWRIRKKHPRPVATIRRNEPDRAAQMDSAREAQYKALILQEFSSGTQRIKATNTIERFSEPAAAAIALTVIKFGEEGISRRLLRRSLIPKRP